MLRFDSPEHHTLPDHIVLDAFFLHGLLIDKARRQEWLSLPHHGAHSDRLSAALALRNQRFAGTGQEMWSHACNNCMKIITREDGKFCEFHYMWSRSSAHRFLIMQIE